MAKNTNYVEELGAKITFLSTDPVAMSVGCHNSEAALLNSIRDNARTTVRSGYSRNMINADIEGAIALKCKFDQGHPTWRLGSKIDFERYYHGCHPYLANGGSAVAGLLEAPLVLLKEDLSASVASTDTVYASLALRTGQSNAVPGEIRLGFDLNCPEDKNDGLTTGVKRCVLAFDCGGGRTNSLSDRTGYPDGAVIEGVRITPLSVSAQAPSWVIESVNGKIIGVLGAVPHTFIQVNRLTPADAIKATIRICVKNIQTTFALPEETGQSAAKRKVKERLVQLNLEGAEDGEAVIATTEMKLAVRDK